MSPSFLPYENARFVLGETPLLLLADAGIHEDLPALHAPGGRMPICPGWQLMARLTMCVVDGPGEAGCLIPTVGPDTDMEHVAAWCSACQAVGGAVVVSMDSFPERIDWEELFTSGAARGGFVRGTGPDVPGGGSLG